MKDIEAYIFLTYYAPKLGLSKKLQLEHLNDKSVMPMGITMNELDLIVEFPPSTKHLVHAYRDMGFNVSKIAELLKIPQPNVSYHLKTPPKAEWVSQTWESMRRLKRRTQTNIHETYYK